jgi:hypothetical protein
MWRATGVRARIGAVPLQYDASPAQGSESHARHAVARDRLSTTSARKLITRWHKPFDPVRRRSLIAKAYAIGSFQALAGDHPLGILPITHSIARGHADDEPHR